MKPLVYTKHAKKRMKERSIMKKDVKNSIFAPDYTVNRFENEVESFKKTADSTLKVVFADEGKFIRVITAYYIR